MGVVSKMLVLDAFVTDALEQANHIVRRLEQRRARVRRCYNAVRDRRGTPYVDAWVLGCPKGKSAVARILAWKDKLAYHTNMLVLAAAVRDALVIASQRVDLTRGVLMPPKQEE